MVFATEFNLSGDTNLSGRAPRSCAARPRARQPKSGGGILDSAKSYESAEPKRNLAELHASQYNVDWRTAIGRALQWMSAFETMWPSVGFSGDALSVSFGFTLKVDDFLSVVVEHREVEVVKTRESVYLVAGKPHNYALVGRPRLAQQKDISLHGAGSNG